MEKKQKVDDTMNKDIISELPTNLIESILERLSINEAVRTSILSKKWRYIWTSLPNLVLNKAFYLAITPNKRENADQYCRIIDRILVVHSGLIQNFVVYIPFAENDIDLWMLILLRNQIKGLIIHNDGNLRPLKLPSSLYSCHQLTHLLLNNVELNPPLAFSGFSNLKQLILSGTSISTHTGLLISTLPSLLTLNLRSCTGIENFKIMPPILKDFSLCKSAEVLWQYLHAKTNISLLLVTVGKKVKNAKQFKLTTFLANLPKLVTLVLDGFSLKVMMTTYMILFLCLRLMSHFLVFLFFLKLLAAGISPKLYRSDKLTNIMLGQIRFSDLNQVSCVLSLLRSCPNLRKLQINVQPKNLM
jgi:hypothetical protein